MVKKVTVMLMTAVMLVVMSFSFVGCEEELPTPEEVIEKLVKAHTDVKSYEMEGNMDMKMVLDIPEEEMSIGIPMDINAAVDINAAFDGANEEMVTVMDIDIDMSGEATMKMAMEMYLVDGWMYMMMDMPMMSPQWKKTEMSYSEVLEKMESIDFTEMQVELLKSSDIMVAGEEKVDDVECYTIEVSPDMSKLLEILIQQSQLTGDSMFDMPVDDFDEMMANIDDMIKSVSAKYWIAKDTYYIVKGDVAFIMEMTPEAMGVPDEEGSISMDVTMFMRLFNYDKPVSIVLPTEAEDAVEEAFW
jgi:outer membrane lipoprotein-sorting protein